MTKINKSCTSCGMPMNKDISGWGTKADGTKSTDYCAYCYDNGNFTFTGTVNDFQEYCRQKMIEGGHSRFTSWLFTRGMKRLDRWKK